MPTRDQLETLAAIGIPPDEEFAELLSFGLDGFLEFWATETLEFLQRGGSELRFVQGPYGRGKTHLLFRMARLARSRGFVTAMVSCSSESKPFASAQETYRSVVPSIRFPDSSVPEGLGLFEFLSGLSDGVAERLNANESLSPGYRHLLLDYRHRMQVDEIDHRVTSDLRNLITAHPENRVRLTDIFRLDRTLRRPLGKLTKRNAMSWVRDLFTLPRILGYKGLIVLFDETGADFHLGRTNTRQQRQHLANLRNIVDCIGVGKLPGCSITYAVAADLMMIARETLPPLVQRIDRMDRSFCNPRAVSCDLDELTNPCIESAEFWQGLGKKLIEISRTIGCDESKLAVVERDLPEISNRWAGYVHNAAVRDFIKTIAGSIVE